MGKHSMAAVLTAVLVLTVTTSAPCAVRDRQQRFRQLHHLRADEGWTDLELGQPVRIRIGIMEGQTAIRFTAEAALIIACGDASWTIPAGETASLRLATATAGKSLFWPVVSTIALADEGELPAATQTWTAHGHEVTSIRAGARLRYLDYPIHDSRRWYVALEAKSTRDEAEATLPALAELGARPWVLETAKTQPRGTMELVGPGGEVLGRLDGPATITSPEAIRVLDVEYGVGFPWHGFEDRSFRGDLEVRVDKSGKVQLINTVDIEAYLQGVVPSEMSWSYPLQALAAQAVSARGETLAKLRTRHLADPYDLCAGQHCQVYSGLSREHPNSNEAVQSTRGRVLVADGAIVDTVYSACCGGHTENNDYVWSTEPHGSLRGVPDLSPDADPFLAPTDEAGWRVWFTKKPRAWCANPPSYGVGRFRWTQSYDASALDELVAATYPEVGSVRSLRPLRRGVSGRLRELEITGTGATVVVRKEWPIRRLLGGLNSAAFVIDVTRDEADRPTRFTFTGAGWGHGVGMCQWGARGQALGGRSYRQILLHYFKDTTILPVYELGRDR